MLRTLVIATAITLIAVPVVGAELKGGPWYAGMQGGATILMDADNTGSSGINIESEGDAGFAGGVFAGYKFGNGLRIEGEGTYRRNDLDTLTIANDGGLGVALGGSSLNGMSASADGDVSSFSFMANVWYEPDVFRGLLPYIGGGIGVSHVSADASVSGVQIVDDSDTVFAGQAGTGVGYAITPDIVLALDYRFLITADPTFDDATGAEFDSEYMVHNIMLGIRGHF